MALAKLLPQGELCLPSVATPNLRLRAEHPGPALRLTLEDLESEGQTMVVDCLSARAQEEELASLREILGGLPLPVWRTDADGTIRWANESYLAAARTMNGGTDLVWPLPAVFDLPPAAERGGAVRRVGLGMIVPPFGQWFDCHVIELGAGFLHMALPADRVIKAENSRRDFIQTLAKTFAHLSVGLAIFDRDRQLILFNPALTDLTAIGPDFLSGRPTLVAFLDRLREGRILPEPKDYASWRQKMHDLERAASVGSYEETWVLPAGQTYRVTGRPHPERALAFLIEDISAETSLARRFRSEIEMGQSVINALNEALAVFSPMGELILSNRAHAALWGFDPTTTLGTMGIVEATSLWQGACLPSPLWGDLRDFVLTPTDRADWEGEVTLSDGTALTCAISPMTGGATLVRFVRPVGRQRIVRRHRRPHVPRIAEDRVCDA